jgi:hypothetical protein
MSGSNKERMSVRYIMEAAQQLGGPFLGRTNTQGQMWIGQVSHVL